MSMSNDYTVIRRGLADIPSDITDDEKAYLLKFLNASLNAHILYALLHGIYTGILAVTLWNIFIKKFRPIRRALVIVIVLLYALITMNFAANWSYLRSAFIDNGQTIWTTYLKLNGVAQAAYWEMGIPALTSTVLADLYIIWCCWMVWGRRWSIVLLPILSIISATVFKIIGVHIDFDYATTKKPDGLSITLYISFILATTLWCTLLIIYRILAVTGVRHGVESRLRNSSFRRFIKVITESYSLYSVSLILYLALTIGHNSGQFYLDAIASIMRGVAPTLLVGRAAAGHTRPNEEDEGSVVSAIRFQTSSQSSQSSQPSASGFQESTMQSAVLEMDIEAQREQLDELVVVVERMQ